MSFTQLYYHIVFSTKERRRLINIETIPRLCDYLGGIVRNRGQVLVTANGMPDHIHLVAKLKPAECLADFVRDVKANSSKWYKETDGGCSFFAWQTGYSSFTVSYSGLQKVVDYVNGQQAHHEVMSYETELIQLLDKHGVEYDKRYIFD